MNVWRTNWQSIIDLVEKLCYNNIFRSPNIIQSTKFLLCTVIDFSKRSVHFVCLPYNMYYMKGGLMYLIRNNLQNYTKISNLWLLLGFYYMYWSYYTYWLIFFSDWINYKYWTISIKIHRTVFFTTIPLFLLYILIGKFPYIYSLPYVYSRRLE